MYSVVENGKVMGLEEFRARYRRFFDFVKESDREQAIKNAYYDGLKSEKNAEGTVYKKRKGRSK